MNGHPDSAVPLPPMEFNLWGTTDEAKPLSAGVRGLLTGVFNVDKPLPRVPDADILIGDTRLTPDDVAALASIVGADRVTGDKAQKLARARGKSYPDLIGWRLGGAHDVPDAVVAPATDDEVLEILRWATRERVAVVPFGGGTTVVGGVAPERGGMRAVISLDLALFDDVTDVDPESGLATLGAGLTGPAAELRLAEHGLQIGHYPQSFPYATIGGYAATRSSGQSSAGYGRFDEMVRSLTVVTPSGILHVGDASPATAAGPDLREVFLGSEGAFGVITRVRLRVHPIPQVKRYEAFTFPTFAAGVAGLRAVEQAGAGPTVIRLSDDIESSLNLTSGDSIGDGSRAPEGCLCLTMFEGTEEHAASRHAETRALLIAAGGTPAGEEPVRSWERGRFEAPVLRDGLLDNGAICETLETATDWSNVTRLKHAVTRALSDTLRQSGTMALVMCHVSHVYREGCSLYFTVIAAQGEDPELQWWSAKGAASRAIVEGGGTITHHHSVGTDHAPYLADEIGGLGVAVLRAVKAELDPAGIMNPGKLLALD
ncbi:FAD-binding oxidoreductase [Corynebacterium sp. NPDC060344]|uniref:FAD-binding oxidoreductase n=1 Tax=Corynebacterium sp. NPDC060344 TaxID=3347101 RepID=UPI0036475DE5